LYFAPAIVVVSELPKCAFRVFRCVAVYNPVRKAFGDSSLPTPGSPIWDYFAVAKNEACAGFHRDQLQDLTFPSAAISFNSRIYFFARHCTAEMKSENLQLKAFAQIYSCFQFFSCARVFQQTRDIIVAFPYCKPTMLNAKFVFKIFNADARSKILFSGPTMSGVRYRKLLVAFELILPLSILRKQH